MEDRPSGFAVQAEIPNHRKLRRLTRALREWPGVSRSGWTKVPRYQGKLGLLKSQSTG
jgi:hypothetical protein